jgi:multiple antibiotic resistance protein
MLSFPEYVKIFIGLMAIVNPVGAVPIFITLTADLHSGDRPSVANIVAVTVCTILLCSLVLGDGLLRLFGISIFSFRVGGGILLLLMSVSMLHARLSPVVQTKDEAEESKDKDSVAVVPLSIPLLAGPGAISTVIIDAHRGHGIVHYLIIGTEVAALSAILWVVLRLSPLISKRISATGINVFTRIMGLILAAIAVEFIANGLKGLFPGLA